MTKKKRGHHMSIMVTEEQFFELQRLIPWGVKSSIYAALTNELIRILNEEGFHPVERLVVGKAKVRLEVES